MAEQRTFRMELPKQIITPKIVDLPNTDQLKEDLKAFLDRLPRYEWLEKYYTGAISPIYANRPITPIANFCNRFTDRVVGYLTGNPPVYSAPDDSPGVQVTEKMTAQNLEQTEGDVMQDLCIFGAGYQLTYLDDKTGDPKVAQYRPKVAFVAYDDTVKNDSVYGAIVQQAKNGGKISEKTKQVDLYTDKLHLVYLVDGDKWQLIEQIPHIFGRVPLIEYRNGRYGMALYEQIIGLQDAYNSLLSDRVEDKRRFSSASLVLKGQIIGKDKPAIEKALEQLKEVPVIQLDTNAEAGYITKTMSESDNQTLQDALASEMYEQVGIPNMADEAFSGNSSGIAIQFKLLGLDLTVGRLKSSFNKGFTRRVKLYYAGLNNLMANQDFEIPPELDKVAIVFKENIPTDMVYEANTITTYYGAGLLSRQTALDNMSMIEDTAGELLRLLEDDSRKLTEQVNAWGGVNPAMGQPGGPAPEPPPDEDTGV